MTLPIVAISVFVLAFLVIYVYLMHYVARQARERGYSYWQWMILGLLGNSIICAVLLALLPDRSLEARRHALRNGLTEKLRTRRGLSLVTSLSGVVHTSIGDMATMDPEKLGASMGDQPTSLGNMEQTPSDRQQSLGDQATFMPKGDQ